MIVFGIFAALKRKARTTALQRVVKERTSDRNARLIMVGDFLEATVRALAEADKGEVAMVGGCIDDVLLPTDCAGFGRTEWQESWLRFLEEHHIAFLALPSASAAPEAGAAASIIRSYNRAANVLAESVRKMQHDQRRDQRAAEGGYVVCGRPPYGYCVRDGVFVIDPGQAKAVKHIFRELRSGKPLNDIIDRLRSEHGTAGIRKQYWDRVKVHRILKHRQMYCLGKYDAGDRGHPVHIPELAFLPPEWIDTAPVKATQAAAAAT